MPGIQTTLVQMRQGLQALQQRRRDELNKVIALHATDKDVVPLTNTLAAAEADMRNLRAALQGAQHRSAMARAALESILDRYLPRELQNNPVEAKPKKNRPARG